MSDMTPPATPSPCPECGGERVNASCDYHMNVQVTAEGAFFPKTSPLQALVCTNCGYTTLYATRPDKFVPTRSDT